MDCNVLESAELVVSEFHTLTARLQKNRRLYRIILLIHQIRQIMPHTARPGLRLKSVIVHTDVDVEHLWPWLWPREPVAMALASTMLSSNTSLV